MSDYVELLCVGGISDGQWIVVERGATYLDVAFIPPSETTWEYDSELNQVSLQRYTLFNLGGHALVLAPQTWNIRNVVQRLVETYQGQNIYEKLIYAE